MFYLQLMERLSSIDRYAYVKYPSNLQFLSHVGVCDGLISSQSAIIPSLITLCVSLFLLIMESCRPIRWQPQWSGWWLICCQCLKPTEEMIQVDHSDEVVWLKEGPIFVKRGQIHGVDRPNQKWFFHICKFEYQHHYWSRIWCCFTILMIFTIHIC